MSREKLLVSRVGLYHGELWAGGIRPFTSLLQQLYLLSFNLPESSLGVDLAKEGCPGKDILLSAIHSLVLLLYTCSSSHISSRTHYFLSFSSPFTIHLLRYSSICPSIYPPIFPLNYLPITLVTHPSSSHPSTCHYLPTHYQFTSPSIHPSISPSTDPATHIYIYIPLSTHQ